MTHQMSRRRLNFLKRQVAVWGGGCVLIALLAGCRSTPLFGRPDADPSQDVVKLRSGLVMNIVVLVAGEKEIDEPAVRILENGAIVLPLLGKITVAGMGLDDLRDRLTRRYQLYYVRPQVMVDFASDTKRDGISPWGFVTVLGRVKEPGRIVIPATRDLTVSGAIQQAGGFDTSAKDNAILVTRSLPDGTAESRTINLKAVGTAGRLEDDIVLEADDVVFVPEAMF